MNLVNYLVLEKQIFVFKVFLELQKLIHNAMIPLNFHNDETLLHTIFTSFPNW
jgi:hypothetical protein